MFSYNPDKIPMESGNILNISIKIPMESGNVYKDINSDNEMKTGSTNL